MLATEVENLKPFLSEGRGATELWINVAKVVNDKFGGSVDYLGAKRRFNLLIDNFKKDDRVLRKK